MNVDKARMAITITEIIFFKFNSLKSCYVFAARTFKSF